MKKVIVIANVLLMVAAVVCGATFLSIRSGPPDEKRLATLLHDGPVTSLTFSPDGRFLVGGSAGVELASTKFWLGRIKVWDTATLQHVDSYDCPQHVASLAFSPKGTILAVALMNTSARKDKDLLGYKPKLAEVQILSFPKLKEEKKFELGSAAYQVLFSRDGNLFAASYYSALAPLSAKGALSVWSVPDWKEVRKIESDRELRLPFTNGPDNASFLYVARPHKDRIDSHVYRVMQLRPDRKEKQDKIVATFDEGNMPNLIDSISTYADKSRILYQFGSMRILNLESGKELTPESLTKGTFNICKGYTVSADGKWLACFGKRLATFDPPGTWIVLWDLEKSERVHEWRLSKDDVMPTSIALSPDKKLLAVGNGKSRFAEGVEKGGEVILYDIAKFTKR